MNERFGKDYKLCSQKQIELIFQEKKTIKAFPFVVHYSLLQEKQKVPFQLVFSAPKRLFKKAHDRNRIKRLMRESFRKNKLILETFLKENDFQLALFVIYTSKEELELEIFNKKTVQLYKQLIDELSK